MYNKIVQPEFIVPNSFNIHPEAFKGKRDYVLLRNSYDLQERQRTLQTLSRRIERRAHFWRSISARAARSWWCLDCKGSWVVRRAQCRTRWCYCCSYCHWLLLQTLHVCIQTAIYKTNFFRIVFITLCTFQCKFITKWTKYNVKINIQLFKNMPCLSRQGHKIQQSPNLNVPDNHSHTGTTFRRPTWKGGGI